MSVNTSTAEQEEENLRVADQDNLSVDNTQYAVNGEEQRIAAEEEKLRQRALAARIEQKMQSQRVEPMDTENNAGNHFDQLKRQQQRLSFKDQARHNTAGDHVDLLKREQQHLHFKDQVRFAQQPRTLSPNQVVNTNNEASVPAGVVDDVQTPVSDPTMFNNEFVQSSPIEAEAVDMNVVEARLVNDKEWSTTSLVLFIVVAVLVSTAIVPAIVVRTREKEDSNSVDPCRTPLSLDTNSTASFGFTASETTNPLRLRSAAVVCDAVLEGDKPQWYSLSAALSSPRQQATCYDLSLQTTSSDLISMSVFQLSEDLGCDESLSCVKSMTAGPTSLRFQPRFDIASYLLLISTSSAADVPTYNLTVNEHLCARNNQCETATQLLEVPSSIEGATTEDATPDNEQNQAPSCSLVNAQGPSVYYRVQGTGQCLAASLRGTLWDTYLSVYEGTCADDGLVCVTANDDEGTFTYSSVTWKSKMNSTYYLRIAGVELHDMGRFDLTMSTCEEVDEACDNAPIPTTFPYRDEYPTNYVNTSVFMDLQCHAMRGTDFGHVYSIEGTGNCFIASTLESTADNVLALFRGDDCTALQCITDSIGGLFADDHKSEVDWQSNVGETYWLVAAGFGPPSPDLLTTMQEVECPTNDLCQDAMLIETLPFITNGTTTPASSEEANSPALDCRSITYWSKSLWWSLTLDDDACIMASTTGSNFDTTLSVYERLTDDCADLSCQAENGDFGPLLTSLVSWQAKANRPYNILLSAFGSLSGNFELTVSTFPCLSNQACVDAEPLGPLPSTRTGNLALVTSPIEPAARVCDLIVDDDVVGVWYSFGTPDTESGCVEISTQGSNFDSVIAVFDGGPNSSDSSCSFDSCAIETRDERLAFNPQAGGRRYYVLVASFGASVGDFTLRVNECD